MDRDNNGYLDKKDRPARHMYERKGHHRTNRSWLPAKERLQMQPEKQYE